MFGQPAGSGSGAAGSLSVMLASDSTRFDVRPVRKLPHTAPDERMPCTSTTGEVAWYLAPIQSIATAHTSQPMAPVESGTSRLATSISTRRRLTATAPGEAGNLSLLTGTVNDCETQIWLLPLRTPSFSSFR